MIILNFYSGIILADAILSYLPQFQRESWAKFIKQLADYTLNPIRKILPKDLPVDLSHVIVLIVIMIIESFGD